MGADVSLAHSTNYLLTESEVFTEKSQTEDHPVNTIRPRFEILW